MKKMSSLKVLLFSIYSFIFIFSSINREFLFFGLDLRFIAVPLGILLILLSLFDKTKTQENVKPKEKDPIFKILCVFYGWCLLSNISWFWNGLDPHTPILINQLILLLNNFLALIVFYKYKHLVKSQDIHRYIIFSCIVLALSFLLTGLGFKLSQISGTDEISMVTSYATVPHKNIFGGDFRIAGYARDANCASLILMVGLVSVLYVKTKKVFKLLFGIIFLIALGFSCSKTILAAIVISFLYEAILKIFAKKHKITRLLYYIVPFGLFIGTFLLPHVPILENMQTMSTRFYIWNMAEQQFLKSPIIGSGIGSSRSAIAASYGVYVQPHSNYWQLLTETGIIGAIIFSLFVIRRLEKSGHLQRPAIDNALIIILCIFGLNFEIIELQIFLVIAYIFTLEGRSNA